MSAINRAALREHLWPGIFAFWGEYDGYPEEWSDVYKTRNSSKAYEEYVQESFFGLAPVKEPGAPIIFDEAGDVWKGRVEMVSYGLGFAITEEAIDDDQYFDLVPKYTRALRRSMRVTKEVRAASFLEGVFTTSMTGDGKPVCAADHPLKNGGTISNVGSANADLNETSLEAAYIQIGMWTDERGLRIATRPTKLIVPNALQFVAERLTATNGRPATADNDAYALKTSGKLVPYAVNHYVNDQRAWYMSTDIPEGMTFWNRKALTLDEGDGLETRVMKVIAYERYAFSCMDYRSLWGSPGTP